jgi:1,4-alpha-glucan branching enzyme
MGTAIEFKLFAPNNQGAALSRGFYDWQELPMEKGEDGCFRTFVDLEDGGYQYSLRCSTSTC